MYYVPSEKGLKYLSYDGEGPKAAATVLDAFREFDDPNPKTPGQLARVLGLPETDVEKGLDYLTREGFLASTKAPAQRQKSPRSSIVERFLEPVVKIDDRTMEAFTEKDIREAVARREYEKSDKGKAARQKYNHSKGRLVRREWQRGKKGKAAQARWRSKIHLNQTGLAKLNDGQWTPLHDLLAFVHLEHPTKDQLAEEDFKTLYDNKYI